MTEAGARQIEPADLDWVAGAPRSISFGDIYFSGDGLAESRHVFLNGNDLGARLPAADRFVIGELGFGTGLNLLAVLDLKQRVAPRLPLEYLSIEKHPLRTEDLRRAHQAWPELSVFSAALIDVYPPLVSGVHRLKVRPCDGSAAVGLTLVFGDAGDWLPRLDARIDAWFLDGFAPSKNPDLWRSEIFAELARLSAPDATAATFTVAGAVRRDLAARGFAVEKRAGYGRKREMLTARPRAAPPLPSPPAPWFRRRVGTISPGATVAVIGGGVAGASLAHALTNAGLKPTIVDPRGIAGGASGNPAGLIMPRLDLGDTPASRFFRSAYLHVLRTIDRLDTDGRLFPGCGALLLAQGDDERARQKRIAEAGLLPDGWIEPRPDGLFFPQAGVIDPPEFCRRLAAGAEIVRKAARAIVETDAELLVIFDAGDRRVFDAVILANGRDALRFAEGRTLPLKGVMGQIDCFPDAEAPQSAVAFGPWLAPAPAGGLVIGATYERLADGVDASISARATHENIAAIAHAASDIAAMLHAGEARPRASVRCQTPDRLPVVGPLPDWDFFGAAYDDLRNGKRRDYPPAEFAHGRYILSGLGSRGLVTAPLCAAFLAAELTGAPFPLERDVADALHPARFFIRDLRRSRTKSEAWTGEEENGAGEKADQGRQ